MGSVGSFGTSDKIEGLVIPVSKNFMIADMDTEHAWTFPDATKFFRVCNDGPYLCKLSYQEGESDLNYMPIYPGDDLKVYGITAASVTIFMQAPGPILLHIESWT